jgi:hypothetical protein
VRVTLDPSDTYTLVAQYATVNKVTDVFTRSDVYCDEFQEIFTSSL